MIRMLDMGLHESSMRRVSRGTSTTLKSALRPRAVDMRRACFEFGLDTLLLFQHLGLFLPFFLAKDRWRLSREVVLEYSYSYLNVCMGKFKIVAW